MSRRSASEALERFERLASAAFLIDGNAVASWRCMPPTMKVDLCAQAGVPAAADALSLEHVTPEVRAALRRYVVENVNGLHPSAWGLTCL